MYEITVHVSPEEFAALEEAVFAVEHPTHWNLYEDFEGKGHRILGVFDAEELARSEWSELAELTGATGSPTVRELPESEWKDSYKEHFKPWTVGGLHWVPVWLVGEYEIPVGDQVVWLDPGMAFGTGNHETTRLCVERLLEVDIPREMRASVRVADAGTGSGILAISAYKLGFTQTVGFDNDQDSVKIACENSALNGIMELGFELGDLVAGFREPPYDIIMANILAPTLIEYREYIVAALRPGGTVILSGILSKEADSVRDAYSKLRHWKSVETHELGEWSSVTLRG